jgi:transposase InsO family protein
MGDVREMTVVTAVLPRTRRAYDHRLREQVVRCGAKVVASHVQIPRSTASTWRRRGLRPVVTTEPFDQEKQHALDSSVRRQKRARALAAVVRLLLALLRASGFSLTGMRLPEGQAKAGILRAVTSAESFLPLAIILRILGLESGRYHAWRRAETVCELTDRSSCPRTSPGQLTATEVATIKNMVLAPEYRHMPLGTLARYAQRIGNVFASASTWAKLVRERGWRRPRQRVHPPKPTVGVRASQPNEIWHVDTTVINLLDGTKAYLQAVIDNYSRKILAWTVSARLDPSKTCQVLLAAGKHLVSSGRPLLFADSGVENVNGAVDSTLFSACLERILAQVEVAFSNSMIEAFWRSLKHQWLFLNTLDSVARVRTVVEFYVNEHNTKMPHPAFGGQTPDEMFFGTGSNVPEDLALAKSNARTARLAANRALSCERCLEQQANPPEGPLSS